jgi:hypothetical protein
MGFELFVKRAKIGTSKHVRVRPRFEQWAATGTITVMDPQLSTDTLQTILTYSGARAGIGDWRPGSPTPGQFGMFTATIDQIS